MLRRCSENGELTEHFIKFALIVCIGRRFILV